MAEWFDTHDFLDYPDEIQGSAERKRERIAQFITNSYDSSEFQYVRCA